MLTLVALNGILGETAIPIAEISIGNQFETSVSFDLLQQKARVIRETKEQNNDKAKQVVDKDTVNSHNSEKEEDQLLPAQSQASLSVSSFSQLNNNTTDTYINNSPYSISDIRCEIFRLGAKVGDLCHKMLLYAPLDADNKSMFWIKSSSEKDEISVVMGNIFLTLFVISQFCQLDLRSCILKKIQLNGKKYPVELCKGKAGKYTVYSKETGITKTSGQSTMSSEFIISKEIMNKLHSVEDITVFIRQFASERHWEKHHSPRNIVFALMGELGELAEVFQWKGDANMNVVEGEKLDITEEERDHIGQELADVSIYLLRLADVCNIDLGKAASVEL